MESGQDAGALASPAPEADDDAPALGTGDAPRGGDAPGDGAARGAGGGAPHGAGDADAAVDSGAPGDVRSGGAAGDVAGPDAAPHNAAGAAGETAGDADGDVPSGADGDVAGGADDEAAAGGDGGRAAAGAPAPVWAAAMAALLALLIAGVAVAAVFLGHVRGSQAQRSRQQGAVAATRKAVADLTTASYQQPQQYVDKLRADATGSFLSMFTNSAGGFKNVLQQGKVQTTGKVVDVGVQHIGTDTAQLSVLADVTVKNSQTPKGSQRAYRLSVSMISAGSHWLVSSVRFVQ